MSASGLRLRRTTKNNVVSLERSSTKERLIEVGELLYGQHGFNGNSLREIASEAGQRNCNAVQYHFKSKYGFVSAILADRVFRLDALRAQRFAELRRGVVDKGGDEALGARDLLKLIWLPDLSIVGPNKIHTYVRFSLQYYLQPDAGAHPFYTRDAQTGRTANTRDGELSCLFEANKLLRRHFQHTKDETFYRRLMFLSMMYQCSVVEHDNEQALGARKTRSPYDVESIIDMALGALSAPD
jgi:AcrR family transcriptional regulator